MRNPIKESNLADLAEYRKSLFVHPELRFLFFELTDRCNLNCLHCGSRCTGTNMTYLPEIAVEKTLRSVAAKLDPSQIMVCLTGGEPFLCRNLYRIIRMARNTGFHVGITTNGTLIDEKAAHSLAAAGLDTITVSLDGIGETHDSFRRSKGCFERALNGIHALKAAEIEPEVLTVVHRDNFTELDQLYDFLTGEDIYSWRLVNMDPIGRAKVNHDLLLSGTQLRQLLEFIRSKRYDPACSMIVTYGCSHYAGLNFENEIRDYYFQCGAGTTVASVMANGNIGACLDIERRPDLIQGSIYRDDFMDIWEKEFQTFRRDRSEDSSLCAGCEHRRFCMGDSAHTWDYDRKEPAYCMISNKIEEK